MTGCSTILYFVLRHTQHKRIPKKQNLINSAVCPRNNPISTTAVHSGCIVCLRGRCLFQIQKKLCFFTEKPQILFIRLKDLCIEQQMLEMKQKEPPASHLWLTNTPKSERERNGDSETFVCPSFEAAASLQFHSICSSTSTQTVVAHAGISKSLHGFSLPVGCYNPAAEEAN